MTKEQKIQQSETGIFKAVFPNTTNHFVQYSRAILGQYLGNSGALDRISNAPRSAQNNKEEIKGYA